VISGEAFLTLPGAFSALVADAIEAETGLAPEASTTGGTSDARFLKALCPVIEFGLCNATMHKRDEAVAIADLETLVAYLPQGHGRDRRAQESGPAHACLYQSSSRASRLRISLAVVNILRPGDGVDPAAARELLAQGGENARGDRQGIERGEIRRRSGAGAGPVQRGRGDERE
jgi:hypothetical protein